MTPIRLTLVLCLTAGTATARPATCFLAVQDAVVIDGPCDFDPFGGDGSFMVTSPDGAFFAQVNMLGKGQAEGWWNETAFSGHAHSSLGLLTRDDACWSNAVASVCAW